MHPRGVYEDLGTDGSGRGLSCTAQVVNGRHCSAESPGKSKSTAYGVWICIAVAEVEHVVILAYMGAKLGLANAHGTWGFEN